MIRTFTMLVATLALAACGSDSSDEAERQAAEQERVTAPLESDGLASNDEATAEELSQGIEDPEDRPIMQAQVVLDRQGFTPGVVDGKMGMSTENAIMGFQEANDLDQTGELDEATKQALSEWDRIPATRVVTIPQDWSDAQYSDIPEDTAAKAEMERLGYRSLDERLAERFHTTVEVLKRLNPDGRPAGADSVGNTPGKAASGTSTATPKASSSATATPTPTSSASAEATAFFRAGQQIRVPNIGNDRIRSGDVDDADWQRTLASLGVGSDQPTVDRVVVSKAGKTLKAYDGEKLVAMYTVSSGSSEFPLPLGNWDIVGKSYNPPYRYDPEVLGNEDSDKQVYQLPPGPNGPVGVVWIDLSKEHYGIHGTPDPETIGRAQSSGCVRLTNWDAARLAQMVSQNTKVEFVA